MTRHVDAPPDRRVLDHFAHPLVDHVAAAERLVELHLAYDVAERRARQRLEGVRKILHRVRRLLRIGHAIVNDRVDVDRDIVLRDHGLARKVQHLLAQVDARRRAGRDALDPAHVGLEIADVELPRSLDERDEQVQTRAGDAVKPAEPLDHHDLRLADDLDRADDDRERDGCTAGEPNGEHRHVPPQRLMAQTSDGFYPGAARGGMFAWLR
jgi:hypothetical protein